ncbi:hybrid-cluster (4Fe-2S-2O) protein in anaerobic terminal reductases [Candidatus Terasakiella magnetica]|uniref:Hydroxylamine reductase n=1 Tax=Candidatus Terasakiella magnetica TaxID=1867952 RepID=A0A1C3REW9_9PROT|nr:hybrid-cluster (4Fe-2S-2O) protein in anaerobic terminal reductases [Candidatus Terasakiella magnetica]
MFCYQCEQTARNDNTVGCSSTKGMCGKDEQTSDLQDLLIYALKGVAQYAQKARELGVANNEAGRFIMKGMFTTLTNVNFAPARINAMIKQANEIRSELKAAVDAANGSEVILEGPASWRIPEETSELLAQAEMAAVRAGEAEVGEDIIGLRALLLYGMKGICAYGFHALVLDQESDEIFGGIEDLMSFLASNSTDAEALTAKALEGGQLNYKIMELLDAGARNKFGTPEPTSVRMTPKAGKCILISGHDMVDLKAILEQTEGTGINVYTHGEMLPSHSYPELKKFDHLAGNYGGAWQEQQTEFADFPGPILMTSNCLIEPQASYRQRIFTTGPVGWPGLRHIEGLDFSMLIQAAKALPGFAQDAEEKTAMVGFGREAILGVADTVIGAVKGGDIKHFFLVGGCDGAIPGRNYYTDFVEQTPKDTIVLTLGCAKYRFNHLEMGDIGGIPRLLDVGQCNDSYSAIQVAVALSKAFECDINELPLSLNISWFEQKAAAVLLTLLALNVKGIHLGPTLPAFLTPAVTEKLVEAFDIKTITTPEADLAECLGTAAE